MGPHCPPPFSRCLAALSGFVPHKPVKPALLWHRSEPCFSADHVHAQTVGRNRDRRLGGIREGAFNIDRDSNKELTTYLIAPCGAEKLRTIAVSKATPRRTPGAAAPRRSTKPLAGQLDPPRQYGATCSLPSSNGTSGSSDPRQTQA